MDRGERRATSSGNATSRAGGSRRDASVRVGVRRDKFTGIAPAREHGGKGDEKDTVPRTEPGPLHSASSDGKLITEECVLGAKFLGRANETRKESPQDAGGPARTGREAHQANSEGGASALP